MQDSDTKQYGYFSKLEAWLSIFVNLLLFGVKYWAGIVSGSVALIADAWHTLSDSISSIVVLMGVKVSLKPPDKDHPFGHGRAELIATVIIGVLLAIIGFNFAVESIVKLRSHEEAVFGTIAIVVTIISILVKEGMAQFAFYAARKTDNLSLKADGWHHRTDAISSAVILAGIFIGKYYWWIDGIMGIIVALLIFYTSWEILREAINPLLGSEPTDDQISKIRTIAEEVNIPPDSIHHIHIHTYGTHAEVTLHIELDGEMTLFDAHAISDCFERELLEKMKLHATVHVDAR